MKMDFVCPKLRKSVACPETRRRLTLHPLRHACSSPEQQQRGETGDFGGKGRLRGSCIELPPLKTAGSTCHVVVTQPRPHEGNASPLWP